MTFNAMQFNRHMFHGASASFTEAHGSCAQTAAMQSANSIIMIMDAMILASIIICAVVLGVIVRLSGISLLVLVLVALVLVRNLIRLPSARRKA